MASRRLTQAERRSRTRRRLLDSAAQLFAKRGFDGTPVEEIARNAGYSIGALYANFGGKDELILAIFDEHLEWIRTALEEIDQDRPDDVVAADILTLLEDNPDQMLVFIEFWAHAVRDARARRRFAGRLAEIRELIEETLHARQGGRGVELPLPASDLAMALLALGRGMALERIADPSAPSRDVYARLARQLLGAGEQARAS